MSNSDQATVALTPEQTKLLEEIKYEQSVAEAHYRYMLQPEKFMPNYELHKEHRSLALEKRTNLFEFAPPEVKAAFEQFMHERLAKDAAAEVRIKAIDERLAKLTTDLDIIVNSQRSGNGNYRSRYSYAQVVLWFQEKANLEIEKNHLKACLAANPTLWWE